MKKNRDFLSDLILFLIFLVIIVTVLLSLDLFGIISLPEQFSLKTYFPEAVEVIGTASDDVYYPDYDATGTTTDDYEESDDVTTTKTESSVNLSDFINNSTTNSDTSSSSTSVDTATYNVTDNSYFYNQLDNYGKTIYSKMYSSLDELKTGTATIDFGTTFNELLQQSGGDQTLTDAFQLSINALLLDHPEIFYLDVTKLYMFTESTRTLTGVTYKVSIGADNGNSYLAEGFYSESDVLTAEAQIQSVLQNIVNSLYGNTYTQIKLVHDYLIDNTTYDTNDTYDMSHGIYGALVNNLAVCDGYAKSFKYILDNIGISCVEVCGTAQNSNGDTENHAWNDVLINGVWYAVDVTWDDPIIVGGRGTLTDDLRYAHFLKGSNTFYSTHFEDGCIVSNGSFNYPTISVYDY